MRSRVIASGNPDTVSADGETGAAPAVGNLVRIFGLGVMIFGLVTAYFVISTAWGLFSDQKLVLDVSTQIEERSGLGAYFDQRFSRLIGAVENLRPQPGGAANGATTAAGADGMTQAASWGDTVEKLPHAYIVAWGIVLALLALIARIGLSALTYGAKLALLHFGGKRTAA